jgi:hypothetical protein
MCLDELLFAPLQVCDLAFSRGSQVGDILSPALPDIQDNGPEEGWELGARP